MSWKNTLVSSEASIQSVIKKIDESAMQIALVVNKDMRLLGTVTDGDIRRSIIRAIPMNSPVKTIMNPEPTVTRETNPGEKVYLLMRDYQVHQIPVVDDMGRVVGLHSFEDIIHKKERENWVVLMMGGRGNRLKPFTNDCPKPLLNVGPRPISETILNNFIEHGFTKFFFSVNYKDEMVKDYYGDGSKWNVKIKYLNEQHKLGTAGSLSLLPEKPTAPIIVMNADVLTTINLSHLIRFHNENLAAATMCVKEYDFEVPYGVVKFDNDQIQGIEEKPVHRFFVNAGIYVLNPDVLGFVPKGKSFDTPKLFELLIANKKKTVAFPIREYWLDIGQVDDWQRAEGEYVKHFSSPSEFVGSNM